MEKYPTADVSIICPTTSTSKSMSSHWSGERTYKGFRLKDWIVDLSNSSGYLNVKKGSTAAKFSEYIIVKAAGITLDKIIPFSAGSTLLDFVGNGSSSLNPSSSDKAQANITYTARTKFTYVISGGEELIGARTQKSYLDKIDWYYYNAKANKESRKTKYYKKTITTPSFNNPDPKAITGTTSGVWIEYPISYKVGALTINLD